MAMPTLNVVGLASAPSNVVGMSTNAAFGVCGDLVPTHVAFSLPDFNFYYFRKHNYLSTHSV